MLVGMKTVRSTPHWLLRLAGPCVLCLLAIATPAQAALTLHSAIAQAQTNDPWLAGNQYSEQSLQAQSIYAGSLPDPKVNLGFANLPTDTFDFNQEAMTQFQVGVSQVFGRGDSLALEQERLQLLSGQYPHQRDDRRAKVAVTVADLWLEMFRATQTIRLIEDDRDLFEHLVDVAQSSYSSGMGRTRQQDLVRAQLELTRLEDRLAMLQQRRDTTAARLAEWLRELPASGNQDNTDWAAVNTLHIELPTQLPEIDSVKGYSASRESIAQALRQHPAILGMDAKIEAWQTGVELAEQKYRPQWSVSASYGYREDDPMGRDRADFFSVGVAFDVPLFTSRRQDPQVQSAVAQSEAVRTDKWLLMRSMLTAVESSQASLMRLQQRRDLYQSRLLREMHEQSEASLAAYTSDDGDFSEVVRAQIAELNARIEALDIDIDRLKAVSQLNYFFAGVRQPAEGDES
tara:strand:- start:151235 stop:152611 length:1377 start_codon:yes stop_codon:yes gene_type:complete